MGIGPYTLFAPTDEAFEELPEGALDGLTDEELTNILLYHVLDNVVDSGDVMEADALIPLTGETIFVTSDNDTVMLNDSAEVIETDITASNGMIHVIDAVLMPPEVTSTTSTTITGAEEPALTTPAQTETPELTTPAQTETPTGTATTTTETETTTTTETTTATATATGPAGEDTIAGILENDGRFSTLLGALQQAGLAETLEGDGPFTVFAPTDEAFAALPEGLVESLSSDQLEEVLLNHVASGIMTYKDLALLTNLPSLSGGSLDIYVTDIMIGDANFIETDIMASNGIIHVIDAVLVPEDLTTPTTTTTTATTTTSPTETETTTTSPTETETTTASPTETETMTTTTETETTTTSPTETETTTTTAGTETTTTSPTETETTTTSPTETATTTTSPDQVAGFPSLSPSYTFEDVPPGYHVFAAQLVDPEGNPLTPPVVIAVLIPVPSSEGGSSQTTTPTSPTTTTTPMNQP